MADLTINTPVQNSTIFPRTCLTGTGPANARVVLYEANVGGKEWGSSTIDAFGNWMIKPSADLQPTIGKNNGMFGLIVAPGEDSRYWSNIVFVNIASTPPANTNQPLKILSPAAGATVYPRPNICGTGPANTQIKLYEAGVGDREWGSTTVDGYGNWIMTPNADLVPTPGKNDGKFGLLVTPDSVAWSNIVQVNIAKAAPVNPNQPLAILNPKDGGTTLARPYIAGTGPANTQITLYEAGVGGRNWGTTVVDGYGNWIMTPNADLVPTPGKNNGKFGLLFSPDQSSGVWSNTVFINISNTTV